MKLEIRKINIMVIGEVQLLSMKKPYTVRPE